jgi:glucose/arabinose dehydrogenase
MAFLPDGRLLVTERFAGRLRVVTQAGTVGAPLAGLPTVVATGQGGLLDVALDPGHSTNRRIYLSFTESSAGGSTGLAVARATLDIDAGGAGSLSNFQVIWRQLPKVNDDRHYGGRLAFSPAGLLFVTNGDRYQRAPAQDLSTAIGKIVRLNPDGTPAAGNPFATRAGALPEIWSLGHRNPYGLLFARDGNLYESEHGPDGGDEFNRIAAAANHGWPLVSEGNDGGPTPRHSTRPDFAAPLFAWTPAIAPGGMIQYQGTRFVGWDGDFILAGLRAQGLIRLRVAANGTASEVGRIPLGQRIREVELGPDGSIWVLEDATAGRLLRLLPS